VGLSVGDWVRFSPACGAKIRCERSIGETRWPMWGLWGIYNIGTYMYGVLVCYRVPNSAFDLYLVC
jgi:hypothetical protein